MSGRNWWRQEKGNSGKPWQRTTAGPLPPSCTDSVTAPSVEGLGGMNSISRGGGSWLTGNSPGVDSTNGSSAAGAEFSGAARILGVA